MKSHIYAIPLSLSALLITGCGYEQPMATKKNNSPAAKPKSEPATTAAFSKKTGIVIETLEASPYTYIHADVEGEKIWVASPTVELAPGDKVFFPEQMTPFKNWPSKALDRTFEVVYLAQFVRKVSDRGSAKEQAAGHPAVGTKKPHAAPAAKVDLTGIEKVEDGQTVAEIHAAKGSLSGKQVVFRGKVVKANENILGKNWVHIQDGSGSGETGDLTVTTTDPLPEIGQTVVVIGKLVLDKDFGAGYKYALMVEEAKLKVD